MWTKNNGILVKNAHLCRCLTMRKYVPEFTKTGFWKFCFVVLHDIRHGRTVWVSHIYGECVDVFISFCLFNSTVFNRLQGTTRSWTQKQCDDAFYYDMINACDCAYSGWYASLQLITCKGTAYAFWKAVRGFGRHYYSKKNKAYCKNECIIPYGSPKLTYFV